MLAGVSGTGVLYLLGLTKPGAKKAGTKPDSGIRTEAQAQQDARRQDAAEALNNLRTANQNQKQQRKAAAKAKVDRLKKELESLRLMGGDSKAVARRAAQIARELAAAAKEYASAGGSGMGQGAAAPSANPSANPSADSAEASAEAEANKAVGDARRAAGEAEAQADDAQTDGEQQEAQAPGEDRAGQPQAGEQGADKAAAGKPEKQDGEGKTVAEKDATEKDDRQAVAQAFQEIAADLSRRAGEKKADSEFAAEVRRLMAMAKGMVERERRRAKQEGDADEAERLSKQVQQAETDMNQSFAAAPVEPAMPVNIVI